MMREEIFVKEYSEIEINRSEILRYAGVNGKVSDYDALLDECISEASDKLRYSVCYREFPLKVSSEKLDLCFAESSSKSLKKNLCGCDSFLLFAATVGIELDRLINKYGRIEPSKALIFQALGAERIESLCDTFCADFEREMTLQNCRTRPRYSAGYGDFSIEMQSEICKALDCAKKIGVFVNESLLLSPSKSVTAIVGIENKS